MFSKLHPQHEHPQQQQPFQFSSQGATIEVARPRRRGRPPGSRNKPKQPFIKTRQPEPEPEPEPEPAMSSFILELPRGSDVVQALARFSTTRNTALCVLTASGTVSDVTLRQPSPFAAAAASTVTFHGRFHILSMSATFLLRSPSTPPTSLAVSLAGPQGQIVGGLVAGRLLAAGTVFVIASSFNSPSYHRLSSEENAKNNSGSGDAPSPPVSLGGGGAAESCVYSCQLPSDVILAPTAKPPF